TNRRSRLDPRPRLAPPRAVGLTLVLGPPEPGTSEVSPLPALDDGDLPHLASRAVTHLLEQVGGGVADALDVLRDLLLLAQPAFSFLACRFEELVHVRDVFVCADRLLGYPSRLGHVRVLSLT